MLITVFATNGEAVLESHIPTPSLRTEYTPYFISLMLNCGQLCVHYCIRKTQGPDTSRSLREMGTVSSFFVFRSKILQTLDCSWGEGTIFSNEMLYCTKDHGPSAFTGSWEKEAVRTGPQGRLRAVPFEPFFFFLVSWIGHPDWTNWTLEVSRHLRNRYC